MSKKKCNDSPVDALRDYLDDQDVELEAWNEALRRMLERMEKSRKRDNDR